MSKDQNYIAYKYKYIGDYVQEPLLLLMINFNIFY